MLYILVMSQNKKANTNPTPTGILLLTALHWKIRLEIKIEILTRKLVCLSMECRYTMCRRYENALFAQKTEIKQII